MAQHSWTGDLAKRPLGSPGLMVPPICIGCAAVGSIPQVYGYSVTEDQALAAIRAVFDGPIHFLDTAPSYGDGESERRIGIVLRERGGLPQDFVLSTKADQDMRLGDFSGDQMLRSIERSQRLLGLERLQLVYLHDPEYGLFENITGPGGALDALIRLHDEGVIEHLGVAGGPISLMMRYVQTGAFEAVITHNRYNLLTHEAEPLLDLATARGLAVLNAAPYGSGILAKGPDAYPRFSYRDALPEVIERATLLQSACGRYDVPLAAAALQFSLRDPRITSTIVGITHPERVAQTVELATRLIPDELWEELERLAGQVPPESYELGWIMPKERQ